MLNSVSYLLVLKNDTFENFSYVCLRGGRGGSENSKKKIYYLRQDMQVFESLHITYSFHFVVV